jgi:hypothetical protein
MFNLHDGRNSNSGDMSGRINNRRGRTKFFTFAVMAFLMLQFLLAFYTPLIDTVEATGPNNPYVTDYYVTPGYGTQATVFTYHATYEDKNWSYPKYMKVRIDGVHLYNMSMTNGSDQNRFNFTYETTLSPGQHNYSIVYSNYYTPNGTEYETPVKWGPYVEHNFVDMNATSFTSTNKNCFIISSKAVLNATVTGDLGGTINFTEIKMAAINTTSFDGNLREAQREEDLYEGHLVRRDEGDNRGLPDGIHTRKRYL